MKLDALKVLAFVQKNPGVAVTVMEPFVDAVKSDPTLLSDAVTAVEQQSPASFIKAHPGIVGNVIGAAFGAAKADPTLLADVAGFVQALS